MIPRQPQCVAAYRERLESLRPLVETHRGAFDRDRRLPDCVFDAMAAAGLFELWLPRVYGGPELSPLDFMEIVEAASALDGSLGWLVGNGGGMSRAAGYLPERAVSAIWGKGPAFVVSSTGAVGEATPVEGGHRVSGRWPFGSGVHHAAWACGLCAVASEEQGAPPVLLSCHFPMEQARVIDNWHVSGMRGTGSADFEVRDVFVPHEFTHAFPLQEPTLPGLLYRIPNLTMYPWTVATVPLGIAHAACDAFVALATGRARQGTSAPLAERELIHSEFGRALTQLHAARALLIDAMEKVLAAIEAGGDRLLRARVDLRVAGTHAAEAAIAVVDRLCAAAGSIAIRESATLERSARDVHAAAKHIAMSPNMYVVAGRVGLGLDTGTVRF